MNSNTLQFKKESKTRVIVMGCAGLLEGFALLGFEVWPDAGESDVEQVILELLENKQKAFVMLESYLAHFQSPLLKRIRESGGDIIVMEIPSFTAPDEYHPVIDSLILQALGPNALDKDAEEYKEI